MSIDESQALDYLLMMSVYQRMVTSGKEEELFLWMCGELADRKRMHPLDKRVIMNGATQFALAAGKKSEAKDVGKDLNRINKWSILGPFDNTSGSGHAKPYVDHTDLRDKNKVFVGKAGQKFSVHEPEVLALDRTINFDSHFARSTDITAYAGCVIHVKDQRPYILSISAFGSLVVELDGEEILESEDVASRPELHQEVFIPSSGHL